MSLPKARDNPTEGIDISNLRTFDLKTQPPTVDYVVEMSFIGKKKDTQTIRALYCSKWHQAEWQLFNYV